MKFKDIEFKDTDIKFIVIGDPHMMGHNPKSRLDFYPHTLLNKINETIDVAEEINATAILTVGDLFHTADAALSTIGRLGRVLQKSTIDIISIIGNHDIHGSNISTYERTGIGLLEKLNIIKILKDDEPMFFQKGNLKVQLTGQSYHYNIDHRNPELDYCRKKQNGVTHLIHLVHGYLSNKKLLFPHTLISAIKDLTEADATFSGHLHTPFLEKYDDKYFGNTGALGRITSSKSEMRMPQVFIVRITQEGELFVHTYKLQSAKPPEEVLDRSQLSDNDLHFYKMNAFMDTVKEFAHQEFLNPYDITREIAASENIEELVKQDVLELISQAEIELQGEHTEIGRMKKIHKLILENFQSHLNSTISFSPKITTIVGPSDNGKTSLIRMIKLIQKNQPNGSDFVTKGKSYSSGLIGYVDGSEVLREKGKNKNRYLINKPDGSEIDLNNFGTEIPEEVREVIGNSTVMIDNDLSIDLLFSDQLEGPFLLSDSYSPATKAKIIDALAKINVFSVSLQNTNRKLTSLNTETRNIIKQIEDIDEELKEYEELQEMQLKVERIEKLLNNLKTLEKRKEQLLLVSSRYKQNQLDIKDTKSIIEKLKELDKIEKLYQNLFILNQHRERIINLHNKSMKINQDIKEVNEVLKHEDNLKQSQLLYNTLSRLISKKNKLIEVHNNLQKISTEISETNKILSVEDRITKAEQIMYDLNSLIELKNKFLKINFRIKEIEKDINVGNNFLLKLQNIKQTEVIHNKMVELLNKKSKLIQLKEKHKEISNNINTGRSYILKIENDLKEQKDKYSKALKNFNKCPVCFSELDENHMHKVIKNL